ncbi:hypothetical protein V6259_14945 [Marinomonas sp. TI.3.20]|uniref:hypothetical protein n=1 Tax=Marinomonas sp. TI.3.20 TaxID=3121296 RepID=UPI0031201E72
MSVTREKIRQMVTEDKKGSVDASLLPILQRLNISSENWLYIVTELEIRAGSIVRQELSVDYYCELHDRQCNRKSIQRLACT